MNKSIGIGVIIVLLVGVVIYFTQQEQSLEATSEHEQGEAEANELVAKEPVWADGEFTIVTSFYPLAFMLEELTADTDTATVVNIGEGRDPHDYRPSTADMTTLQSADLVVLQGADFEPWGDGVREQLEAADVPVVLASADIDLRELGEAEHHEHDDEDHAEDAAHDHDHAKESAAEHTPEDEAGHDEHKEHEADHDEHEHDEDEHDHAHGAYDPHTWVDPVHAQAMVRHLAESLRTLDPEQADAYTEREDALLAELAAIARQYDERLETCSVPSALVSHDAFGYLAARYNLTMHPIAGISTQDEPSAQLLTELVETATEEGATTVLVEESSVAEFATTLAAEADLQTATLNPMSFAIPNGETYLTLLEQNLDALVLAYSCG